MADTKERKPEEGTPNPGAMPRGDEPKAADVAPPAPPGATEAPAAPAPPPKPKQKEKQKGKKPAEGKPAAPAEPEEGGPPPEPAPPPRLHDYYAQRVRPKLAQQFGLTNAHEIPKLVKIVLNVGMGDASRTRRRSRRPWPSSRPSPASSPW